MERFEFALNPLIWSFCTKMRKEICCKSRQDNFLSGKLEDWCFNPLL